MSYFLEPRTDGSRALYIDGDLQFDTNDEAIYHESLALPALCLAKPAPGGGLRVLICGGGDGLALRECLRFPGVTRVDLVDYDPEIVELGRTLLAPWNRNAFDDPRVHVHIADAWAFLNQQQASDSTDNAGGYHAILCDFTVPRRADETHIFTQEWHVLLRKSLAPGGVLGLNAFSPQVTPEAFWCLRKTVRAAGLSTVPYRACIPSFRAQGYGVWAFLVAAPYKIHIADLRSMDCPVSTRQVDMTRLWRGARFSWQERRLETTAPVHTLADPCLLRLLLNPGMGKQEGLSLPTPPEGAQDTDEPYAIEGLLQTIPVLHPAHTREMVEMLAEQVVGVLRDLDIRRLVDSLLKRAAELPADLFRELVRLRDFLQEHTFDMIRYRTWGYRLFAALVITMTMANVIAPDNAFGKGSAGIGHSSFSRGFSSPGGGVRGGFAGGRGGFAGESAAGGRGFTSAPHISGSGFRGSYGRGTATDINGYAYRPRVFVYYGGHPHAHYYRTNRTTPPQEAPREEHKTLFVADDDLMVLDNGEVVITLSDTAYLLISDGTISLMDVNSLDPLLPLYYDSGLITHIEQEISDQRGMVIESIKTRRDWLGWVGWTNVVFSSVNEDWLEFKNLKDMKFKLDAAITRVTANPPPTPTSLPKGLSVAQAPPLRSVELFVNGYLMESGILGVHLADNTWLFTDGKTMWTGDEKADTSQTARAKGKPCPPALAGALKSIMLKLQKEIAADITSDVNELNSLQSTRVDIEKDKLEYQSLNQANGNDGSYEVDYGTDSMPVRQALVLTDKDLADNQKEIDQTNADLKKENADLVRITDALLGFNTPGADTKAAAK